MADNRFGKAVDKRRQEQQAIINPDTPAEEAKEEKKSENAPVTKDGAKASKSQQSRKKKTKKQVSKKMEDNPAAIMFYLPEDVKLDLAIYAKKQKKAVAEILRELVVEKLYS